MTVACPVCFEDADSKVEACCFVTVVFLRAKLILVDFELVVGVLFPYKGNHFYWAITHEHDSDEQAYQCSINAPVLRVPFDKKGNTGAKIV